MTLELFQTDPYRELIREHIYNVLVFLLEGGQEFAVAVEVEHLIAEPELPRTIRNGFGEIALFVLGGYTFESAHIDRDSLFFEAGFGEENIGANISTPLLSIKQIFIGEYPILINISSPEPFIDNKPASDKSMEALLSNPENRKLIKGSKK